MIILSQLLTQGSSVTLPLNGGWQPNSPYLTAILGAGRGCTLRAVGPIAGIWLPLRGRLQLFSGDMEFLLLPKELRVTELDANTSAIGCGQALWVAILGAREAWRNALHGMMDIPTPEPLLLPARYSADRPVMRQAIALARSIHDSPSVAACNAIIESVIARQSGFADAIARCPGRTLARRRQVFSRLQRARNYIAANSHLDPDIHTLARMASYTPWHFIRAFRTTYQETPHAYLVSQRLQHARRLLRSPLAIKEIAVASGFANRSAFSRLFRERFGATPGALRRQSNYVASL